MASRVRSAEAKKSKKEFYRKKEYTTSSDLGSGLGAWIKDLTPLGGKSPVGVFGEVETSPFACSCAKKDSIACERGWKWIMAAFGLTSKKSFDHQQYKQQYEVGQTISLDAG